MLTAVAAYALETAGIRDAALERVRTKAIRKMAIMDAEQAKVLAQLEDAGIWYMPLKGAVLKDLYPAYGIRQMGDRDILIDPDRAEDVREIMALRSNTTGPATMTTISNRHSVILRCTGNLSMR